MLRHWREFDCLYNAGVDPVSGDIHMEPGRIYVDLTKVITCNPCNRDGVTTVRLITGVEFMVVCEYEYMKSLLREANKLEISTN